MKREGDQKTPRGKFKFILLLYRKDRVNYFHSKIKKKIIEKNMGCCDEQNTNNYNKLIKFPFRFSAEKLYLKKNIYDLILVLDFNRNQIKKGMVLINNLNNLEKTLLETKKIYENGLTEIENVEQLTITTSSIENSLDYAEKFREFPHISCID